MSSHVMLKFNRLLRFKLLEKKIVQEIYKILYLRKFYLEFPLWENYGSKYTIECLNVTETGGKVVFKIWRN